MEDTRHTPGPWWPLMSRIGNWTAIASEEREIARIPEAGNEVDANARLIAAAPDLLAALERIISRHADSAHLTKLGALDVHAVHAAIAKARGEAVTP